MSKVKLTILCRRHRVSSREILDSLIYEVRGFDSLIIYRYTSPILQRVLGNQASVRIAPFALINLRFPSLSATNVYLSHFKHRNFERHEQITKRSSRRFSPELISRAVSSGLFGTQPTQQNAARNAERTDS